MVKERDSSPVQPRYEHELFSLKNFVILVFFIAVLFWSYKGSEGNLSEVLGREGMTNMYRIAREMFPPDLSPETLRFLINPALVTLQISVLGTVFAVLFGLPFSFLAAKNVMFSATPCEKETPNIKHLIYFASRMTLSIFRAVPELVWALIFIAAVGLGPFPGVLALTVHNTGIIGKIYSEFIESVDPRPLEALHATGANKLQIFSYGMLPQALPNIASYTFFRWECNIRQATILGFVGAGGIGFYILLATKMLQYDQLLTTILIVLILVVIVDNISAFMRSKII